MTRAAVTIPAESDLLCEGCGYVLNGLPIAPDARCPECGKPTADSAPDLRKPAPWERPGVGSALWRFGRTTAAVLFCPSHFYRTFATRPNNQTARASLWFARIHGSVVSTLFGFLAFVHFFGFTSSGAYLQVSSPGWRGLAWLAAAAVACYALLAGLTRLAAELTVWEAGYRGYRLPLPSVLHGLHYHYAHYLPVALLTAATVVGYQVALARGWLGATSGPTYLYVLSAEVVLAAAYLFKTYWVGMKNMMYANA